MPVIAISSPKGGAGKTTAATLLACELALIPPGRTTVTIIDADPAKHVTAWSQLGGMPDALSVVSDVDEDNIQDAIEQAAAQSTFVIIDLEGTKNLTVGYAIALADLIIIPVQGSQLDANQAVAQIQLIRAQERTARRKIPYAMLFTRTNPAIQPKTLRHIEESFTTRNIPVFATRLADREAYRAIFSYGGSLAGLSDKGVSNLPTAIQNVRMFVAEVLTKLREQEVGAATEPALAGEVA
jgi:chromosome partitioning protein